MKSSLFWLNLTTIFTLFQFLPYILERIYHIKFSAISTPQPSLETYSNWALRSKRAQQNSYENLLIFAIAVLTIIHFQDSEYLSKLTMYYFFARVCHYIFYTLGIPYLRQISYLANMTCIILAYIEVFKLV